MRRLETFPALLLSYFMLVFSCSLNCHAERNYNAWSTPIPNLNSAMEGYDPFSSNPFERSDPGSRGQIFMPIEETKDGRIVINNFIDKAREDIHCDTDFSGTTIKNYYQYRKEKTASYTFASSRSTTTGLFNFKASFGYGNSISLNERSIFNYFRTRIGEIVESKAECITHAVSLSSFIKPTFTEAFIQSLRSLHTAATGRVDDAESARIYAEFVKDYGTHYMKTTSLGSKFIFEKRFSNFSESYKQERDRQRCVEKSAKNSLKIGFMGISVTKSFSESSKECEGNTAVKTNTIDSNFHDAEITTIGSLPTQSFETWAESAKDSPVPIRFELEKMSFLFKNEWLASIAVDQKNPDKQKLDAMAIYDFFENKTSHYCQLMTGQDNCEFDDRGCGMVSDCPYNTQCIEDKDDRRGYKCNRQYGKNYTPMMYTNFCFISTLLILKGSLTTIPGFYIPMMYTNCCFISTLLILKGSLTTIPGFYIPMMYTNCCFISTLLILKGSLPTIPGFNFAK